MFPHSLSLTHTPPRFCTGWIYPVKNLIMLAIQSMENEDLLCKLNEKTGAN